MKKFKSIPLFLGLGLSFLLGACEHMPEVYKRGIGPLPEPEVSMASTSSHQINFGPGAVLSEQEKTSLQGFLHQAGIEYGDKLILDFAPNDAGMWDKKMALDNYLKTIGIWVDGVTTSGANTSSSSAVLVVNKYEATTADCVALSREMFVRTEMEVNKIFGCMTAHNLAVHVADPTDFLEAQDSPPVTQEAVRAIQLFRVRFGTSVSPQVSAASGR